MDEAEMCRILEEVARTSKGEAAVRAIRELRSLQRGEPSPPDDDEDDDGFASLYELDPGRSRRTPRT